MKWTHRDILIRAVLVLQGVWLFTSCETPSPPSGPVAWYHEHAAFRQSEGWKRRVYVNPPVIEKVNTSNSSVKISIADQRGFLLLNGEHVAMDFPVATGKWNYPTPTGRYSIMEKKQSHRSNLYGRYVDKASGRVVKYDAAVREDTRPPGSKFVGAPMPNWMRLTGSGIGMHIGNVPGYPASHGCIRVVAPAMQRLYPVCRIGTPVRVYSAWIPVNVPVAPY